MAGRWGLGLGLGRGRRAKSILVVLALLVVGMVAPPRPAAAEVAVDQHLTPDGPCDATTYKSFVEGPVGGGTVSPLQSFVPQTNRLVRVSLCVQVHSTGAPVTVRARTGGLDGSGPIVATGTTTAETLGYQYLAVDLATPLLTTPGVAYLLEVLVSEHFQWRGTCATNYGTCPAADPDAYAPGAARVPGTDQPVGDFGFRTHGDPIPNLYLSEGAFSGAVGSRVTENFDSYSDGTVITTQVPGVVFSSPEEPLSVFQKALFGGFQRRSGGPQVFRAAFDRPTSGVGFVIGAQDPRTGEATVRFTRTDGSVQEFRFPDNDNVETTSYYVGYESRSPRITAVEVISPPEIGGSGGEEITLDDFTFVNYIPSDIVFAQSGDIWAVDQDGTDATRLTTYTGLDSDPHWSPDGTQIAFVSDRAGGQIDIWVMDADGTDARNLTAGVAGVSADPAWSPEGARIAFANVQGATTGYDVMTVNAADGSGAANLTAALGAGNDGFPAWSPDGSKVAFNRDPLNNSNNEILVVGADGTGAAALTDDPGQATRPSWSGTGIAFVSTRDGNAEIYTMAPDGSAQTRVTTTPAREDAPDWSPDGSRLVFERDGQLITRVLAGGAETLLVATGGSPNWSNASAAAATGLSLTVDRRTAKVGADAVALASLPASSLGLIASGVQASPVGSIPVGSIPVGSIPVGSIPVGSIDLQASPVGSIPVGSIPVGSIPVGSIGLDGVLLSSLGIDLDPILAGSALAGLPRQTLTLDQLLADAVAGPRFRALSLAESGLGESIFGTAGLAPLLLGGLTLQQLPVPPGSSATTWCALFAALGFSCAGAGIDAGTHGLLGAQLASAPVGSIPVGSIPVGSIPVGSIPVGSIPVGSIDLAASPVGSIPVGSIAVEGTPVGSIPVGSIPVGSIPVGSIPVGSIPVGSIDLATSPVGSIPVGSIPVGSIPVGSIPVGSIPVGSIDLATSPVGSIPVGSIANPGDVVSCDVSQSSCTSQTLAQAKANGHLRPGATIAHLGSTVDHITLAEIGAGPLNAAGITLASLTGALGGILLWHLGGSVLDAAGITLASLTGALAGILLGHLEGADFGAITLYQIILDILIRSDFPWESLPIDGMQDFAGFPNNELTYTAAATLKCAAGEDGIVAVRLPAGFRHVAGSAQVTGGGTVIDGPSDPMFSGDGTLKWQVACTGGPLAVALTFRARPGFSVGTFTSDLSASAGAAVSSLEDQAPVLVTEHGEPDSPSTPRTVAADTLVVGHLAGGTDVDVYRFPAPAPGSRVKVFLSHIAEGADFDLAVGTTGTDLLQSSPVGSIPVGSIPMEDEGTTVGASPGGGAETLQDVPLDGIPVDSLSANRDDSDEVAQVLTDGQTEDVLIQVSGYNGSSSPHAYVLRVKVTGPVQLPPCRARSGINPLDDALQVLPAPRADTKAIFLVPRGRLADLHGEAATAAMMGDLATLAARDEVRGQVVPVDADADVRQAYSGWDAQPCSIDAANALVGEIKDVVDQYRSTAGANLRYVVVVGSDESVPFGRVPDLVTLSNEQDATADLGFTLVDGFANALYAAAAHGYILTDDPYAAFSTVPWLGRSLALPQVSVARLVETPEEVSAQIAQYQDAGGLVDPTTSQANVAPPTALTTGYDFLSDGAQQVGAALGRVVGGDASRNVKLINDTWRKHDLTAVYTGADPVPLVASVNGHYNHWQMQPAGPAPGGQFTQTDLFATNEVPTDSLPGRVLFTMGCHGGLNVADRLAPAGAAQARDWAQESARQKAAVYLANTGYGYGDTLASALSERLMALFAEELVDGATTVGEKYVKAKHAYFETMGTYGVFDEKALIEATMYGLPFWRVASAAPLAAGDPSPAVAVDPATGLTTANISIQPLSGTSPEVVAQSDPDRGQWWSARDGRVSFAPYRPLQPLLTRNVTVSGQTARGVFVRRLATTDVGVGDFARARPTIDLGANEPEPLVEGDIYPANVVRLATSRPFGDNSQSLLLVAGQSRSHQGGGPGGIERLVADFGADVAYSDSSDTVAPRIAEVGAVYRSGTGVADFFVEVAAESGASALSRVAVLFKDVDSGGNWELVPLTRVGDTTRWTASRAVASSDLEIFGQAQDGAGNVGYSTNKGRFFTSVLADAAPPEITIQSPAPGDRFEIGDLSAARYSCSDPVGVASCRGPVPPGAGIDTSTPGQHEFLVDAVDAAGNRGQASVFYQVSGSYTFEGFRPPLAPEPTLNLVRAGSTVPVKWQLRDPKGGYVRSLSAVQAIEVWSSSCGTAPVLVLVDVVTDPAAAGLQYDLAGEQYVYHYKVPKRASGCGRLVVRFADGSSAGVGFTYR